MNARAHRRRASIDALEDFDGAFDRAFVLVAFAVNRHLVDHMMRVGRELTDGDYEAALIWGVLAHQNVAHLLPPGALPDDVLDVRGLPVAPKDRQRPLRLRDLVQITRLPRETVRRKLAKLAGQQWIERTPQGWLSSAARLEPTLRDFTRETVRRFLAAADEIRVALEAADAAPSPPPTRPSAPARARRAG